MADVSYPFVDPQAFGVEALTGDGAGTFNNCCLHSDVNHQGKKGR